MPPAERFADQACFPIIVISRGRLATWGNPQVPAEFTYMQASAEKLLRNGE